MDNNTNQPPNDEGDRRVYTETFVFSGNGGQSFLATMQNLMNRFVGGQQGEQGNDVVPPDHPESQSQPSSSPEASSSSPDASSSRSDVDMPPADDPPVPELPHRTTVEDADEDDMPSLDSIDDEDAPPASSRPIRPLPRTGPRPQPHSHFHAHTPNGIIDLFTFSVAPGAAPPPPPPPGAPGAGAATFTFNLGPFPATDVLSGFEAFFLGMPPLEKEREPDTERARVLVKGMEVVPEGLVKRLERAGGVPGGHGTEENAGCAVCWGPLLDDVEPGEWDSALGTKEKEDKGEKEDEDGDEDELHGWIVALPCAHVYHAECLLPWFSRQTTCPTCRFDVDPESLTWTPRPPRVPPPPDDVPPPPPPHDAPHDPVPNAHDPQPPNQPLTPEQTAQAEQHRRANAAEAARLNAFMNAVLLGGPRFGPPPPHPAHAPPAPAQNQDQEPDALNAQPLNAQPLNAQPQHAPNPQSAPIPPYDPNGPNGPIPSAAFLNSFFGAAAGGIPRFGPPQQNQGPAVFGPPPPPPPPPHPHPHAHHFFPLPVFVVPPHPHAHAQPPPHAHAQPPPHAHAQPQPHAAPNPQPYLHPHAHAHPPPQPHPHPHPHPHVHPHPHAHAPPRRERRKWARPEPVGKTLRQRVEEKERELGLRCDDVVCGVAPSDDDPVPSASDASTKRVGIRAAYDASGRACEHAFHPACLVMSARVAGVDEEAGKQDGDEGEEEVQVACPACRAVGSLSRAEWDEGVVASQAEMA